MKESSESIAYKEANDIINHIVNICEIDVKNDDDRVFSLEFIRDLLTLYKGSSKNSAARIISTWNLPYAIENDQIKDGKYDIMLNKKELRDIITGKFLKEKLLFDSFSLELKRKNIEEYTKLFILLGGTEKGLSREALKKCLATADAFQYYPKELLKGDFSMDTNQFKKEADEIIKVLGSDQDFITIKDFVNIMTQSMKFPEENIENYNFKGDS